uniref:Uncharacterized protein n=1 Tax=Arundo donax TaxID=35708 RepID=A0A0A9GRL3_ARUDO
MGTPTIPRKMVMPSVKLMTVTIFSRLQKRWKEPGRRRLGWCLPPSTRLVVL